MTTRIKLLGKPAILDGAGQSQAVRGHQAWALLARLVLARQPLDRRALAAELFAESVDPLGALRWCLAALRKALDSSDCLTGDPVELRLPEGTEVDLWLLEQEALDLAETGPLLAGVEPQCSPEFSTWLLVERTQLAAQIDARLRRETLRALALQDGDTAIRLAELAVKRDVFSESAHILLVKSLALAGQAEAALDHVEQTERLFAEELGTPPSPALRSAARRGPAAPPPGISAASHVRSLIRAGAAALVAGAMDSGIENLRLAVAEAEKTRDLHLLATAMLELGKGLVHAVRGFDDEGAVLLRQCAEIARPKGYAKIAASGFAELGYVEALAGRRPGAAQYLALALEQAEEAENLALIHAVSAFNLVDWGRVAQGLEHYASALEAARRSGSRRSEIWSLGLGARGLLAAGRLEEAEAWLRLCLALIDEYQWVSFRPWPVALLGEARLLQDAAPSGLRPPLEDAYALSCQLRDPCWEAAVARSLALTYAAEGELSTTTRWLDEAYRRCLRETDPYVALQVEILASRVEAHRRLGQGEVAATLAREWIALAARAHMDAHIQRASALLAGGGPG